MGAQVLADTRDTRSAHARTRCIRSRVHVAHAHARRGAHIASSFIEKTRKPAARARSLPRRLKWFACATGAARESVYYVFNSRVSHTRRYDSRWFP